MRGRGCLHATPCRTGHGTAELDPAWPSRTAPVGASGVSRGLPGSRQSPSPRLVRAHPEPGPLPSTGVTQLHRYYGPLRRLPRPSPEGTGAGSPRPLVSPASEHAMPDWIRRTALADLLGIDFSTLSDESLYRNLNRLHPQRAAIEQALAARARTLFNLDDTIYLYDLTSTYFE